MKAEWRLFVSVNEAIIGSNIGLSLVRCQAITRTNAALLSIKPLGTNFSDIWIKIRWFSFKKINLKHLQNGSHFVSASMCYCNVWSPSAFWKGWDIWEWVNYKHCLRVFCHICSIDFLGGSSIALGCRQGQDGNSLIIVLGNGLAPVRCQAIT